MTTLSFIREYRPPKKLRALFIAHYAPLLLIILIGPLSWIHGVWQLPLKFFISVIIGLIIFFIGTLIYFKWSYFWQKTYKGQLVTGGIFQYIRHPHYLSLLIIGIGLSLFFYSYIALFIAIIAIPIMICSIIDEERLLIKQYGKEYKDYMKKVPWRVIPKLF